MQAWMNAKGRVYPTELAGNQYLKGIPIHAEEELPGLIKDLKADQVVFAYSDVPHEYVMHKASLVLSCGADFRLMGLSSTAIPSNRPVISVCAVRTGCGKSPTSRRITELLRKKAK
jgi:predicted GTPase